jgi:hypothetical protein
MVLSSGSNSSSSSCISIFGKFSQPYSNYPACPRASVRSRLSLVPSLHKSALILLRYNKYEIDSIFKYEKKEGHIDKDHYWV